MIRATTVLLAALLASGSSRADDVTLAELAKRVDAIEQRQFLTEKKLDDVNAKLDKILAAVAGKPAAPEVTFAGPWAPPTLRVVAPGTAASGWGTAGTSFAASGSYQYSQGVMMMAGSSERVARAGPFRRLLPRNRSAGGCANGMCGN